ncbi:hypothetical protein B0H13DRAFT_2133159, partial [Mycena leptocephala]
PFHVIVRPPSLLPFFFSISPTPAFRISGAGQEGTDATNCVYGFVSCTHECCWYGRSFSVVWIQLVRVLSDCGLDRK